MTATIDRSLHPGLSHLFPSVDFVVCSFSSPFPQTSVLSYQTSTSLFSYDFESPPLFLSRHHQFLLPSSLPARYCCCPFSRRSRLTTGWSNTLGWFSWPAVEQLKGFFILAGYTIFLDGCIPPYLGLLAVLFLAFLDLLPVGLLVLVGYRGSLQNHRRASRCLQFGFTGYFFWLSFFSLEPYYYQLD